jgi:DNA-binding NarL/FixJ family response regulator
MSHRKAIRVIIVDDHAILREGIRSVLAQQNDILVVGEASNGLEALELTARLQPDLVLMDIAMPEMNGIDATRQIVRNYPAVRVLILTQHDHREYIEPVLRAGASGYVLKRSGGLELLQAIRQVIDQGAFLEPSVARQVLSALHDPEKSIDANSPAQEIGLEKQYPPIVQEDGRISQPAEHTLTSPVDPINAHNLTEREMQVLHLLAKGKSNKEIALNLTISPKTVSVHRSNAMNKLNLKSSFELIRYVTQHFG